MLAAASVQGSAALATAVIERAGPAGAAWLRIAAGAAILALLTRGRRPAALARGARRHAIALGACLAAMNTAFYGAIERLPLGVAVAIEFLGPLGVAVVASRRPRDLAWVGLAAVSVAALTLPRVDPRDAAALGVLLALVAAACWAAYIVAASGLGRRWPGPRGLALALLVATALTTPGGLATALGDLDLPVLLGALGLGLLGTAVPYSLELAALRRMSRHTFGVVLAVEPALAALVGLVFLGQLLDPLELVGIAGVTAAVVGAMRIR